VTSAFADCVSCQRTDNVRHIVTRSKKMSHARSEPKDFKALAPEAYEVVSALGQIAAKAGIDKQLLELIKLRASQINGCAFCVQYHILQGESLGISTDKLNLVVVWREAPMFSSRERAALAWTEALTLVTEGVGDEVYAQARAEFSDSELAYVSSAIASINVWNRLGAAYRWTPPRRQNAPGAAAS
jgi:AhpD family alkylhydroperoxidase